MSTEQQIPEVRFDFEQAAPVFPRPAAKTAILIPIPLTEGGDQLPTFIRPEWGGVQVFYGDYYGIVVDGEAVYGSAEDQWEAMHTQLEPGIWVKTGIPQAYQADAACRIVTLIPEEDGNVREASYVLSPGDWILRQPGGEVQHVKAKKFGDIYFSPEKADQLGLTDMSQEEFSLWAVKAARESLLVEA